MSASAADPPPGEPPLPFCQRCHDRIDQTTIGPLVGLGHCPACGTYTCRWCWAEALGACPSCGIAFGGAGAGSATVARRADRETSGPRSGRRFQIGVGRRLGIEVTLLGLLVFVGSPLLVAGVVESAFRTLKADTSPGVSDSPDLMWIGVEAGTASGAAEIKGAVDYVRLDTPSSSLIATYNSAGLNVVDVIVGPYDTGGVRALDADAWANNAVATYRANPSIRAIEILNEPGGSWFWGDDALSLSNAKAYAELLKKVHDAFVGAFGDHRPLLLASYDGGQSGRDVWGKQVWAADPHVSSYVDGITMHPYGGIGDVSASALGNRSNVVTARLTTGLPVYITEIGWPTAVGQPATADSLQWSEADQATNIYDFVGWARSTGYIKGVIIFEYRDSEANALYGITRGDGTHKKSFEDLRRAAAGLPESP